MLLGVLLWVVWMAFEVVVVVAMIRWGYESGQWKNWRDMEEPKYRMMVDRPLQGWPEREKRSPSSDASGKGNVKEGGG